jgi:hypothetical protein
MLTTVKRGVPAEGKSSPWGQIQHADLLFEGVWRVGTAGHGGIKLNRTRNAKVPAYMRREGGWYEEDSDWCIPAIVFEAEWRTWARQTGTEETPDVEMANVQRTFRNWHPDEYAQWHGVSLESLEGQSTIYDERLFNERHANDLIVIAAWGDWHEDVPKGKVGVVATPGGRRLCEDPEERFFLLDDAEYAGRSRFGFVIDPAQHQPMDPIR